MVSYPGRGSSPRHNQVPESRFESLVRSLPFLKMVILMKSINRELFALWSFWRDQGEGLYPPEQTFEDLPMGDRDVYLAEADYYINEHPRDDWPVDILERIGP